MLNQSMVRIMESQDTQLERQFDIAQVDKNLSVEIYHAQEDVLFYDAEMSPFKIYGVYKDAGMYRRMPAGCARAVSEKVLRMHTHTAGGRVRFVTDSPIISIKVEYEVTRMPHFPLTATGGFDMYAQFEEGDRYVGTFIPPYDVEHHFESRVELEHSKDRVITIHFPLYAQVSKLQIGLKRGSSLKSASDYSIEKPIVFYGSSITQGAAASRPGMNYENILSRWLNCDHINLGFSGSARGEKEMAQYIAGLDMAAFVMDYDHNSSVEELRENHSAFFKIIREKNPNLPILVLPRPRFYLKDEDLLRRDIVYSTFRSAKNSGDKNVYYLSGRQLMELAKGEGSVDYIHPTDLGYYSMAAAIQAQLEPILEHGTKYEI